MVAQSIGEAERGVAVTTGDMGGWMRGRSHLTTPAEARAAAAEFARMTPRPPFLAHTPGGGTLV